MLRLPFAALALLLAAGCQQTAPPPVAADVGSVAEAIHAIEARWARGLSTKTAEDVAAYYAPDAVVLQTGVAPIRGLEEIAAAAAKLREDPNYQLTFKSQKIDVAASGDLAYARGTYELRATDPATGQVGTMRGDYLTLYRKQADRSWKVVEDIST